MRMEQYLKYRSSRKMFSSENGMFQADTDSISYVGNRDCSKSDGAAKKLRLPDLSSKAKHRFHAQRFASKKLRNTHVIPFQSKSISGIGAKHRFGQRSLYLALSEPSIVVIQKAITPEA
jgi:hypothetical protein